MNQKATSPNLFFKAELLHTLQYRRNEKALSFWGQFLLSAFVMSHYLRIAN